MAMNKWGASDTQMQKKRSVALASLRKVLTCAICSIALVALFSVHVPIFPSSKVHDFSDPFKLPTVIHFMISSAILFLFKDFFHTLLPNQRDLVLIVAKSTVVVANYKRRMYLWIFNSISELGFVFSFFLLCLLIIWESFYQNWICF